MCIYLHWKHWINAMIHWRRRRKKWVMASSSISKYKHKRTNVKFFNFNRIGMSLVGVCGWIFCLWIRDDLLNVWVSIQPMFIYSTKEFCLFHRFTNWLRKSGLKFDWNITVEFTKTNNQFFAYGINYTIKAVNRR